MRISVSWMIVTDYVCKYLSPVFSVWFCFAFVLLVMSSLNVSHSPFSASGVLNFPYSDGLLYLVYR